MIELTDEVLCKYLDSELDAEAANEVEQALATDAGARVRLQRMRDADALLRKAIPQITVTDDPLAQYIKSGVAPEKISVTDRDHKINARQPMFFGSLAAGFMGLIVGALAMHYLSGGVTMDTAFANVTMDSGKSLALALDTVKSGTILQRGGDKVTMVLSFNAQDGRHCRVFELANSKGGAEGIACHNDKQWQVAAWDATQGKPDGFRAAGASELVDAAMNQLGGKAALELADEQKLIDGKWQR
jgi:hypothetical protein